MHRKSFSLDLTRFTSYNMPMNPHTVSFSHLTTKPKNPYRITFKQYCEENGISSHEEKYAFLEECVYDSVVPALCTEACEVEPDGKCEHGCPSVLLAVGMI